VRFFYSFLIALSSPFVLLYFALRGLRDSAYLGRWNERFGFIPAAPKQGGILVHAASVGEFNAATPLIRALLKSYPDLPLVVTTLTPTGAERVKAELGDKVLHHYIPLDLTGAVARFLNRLQPRVIIVMETEVWPNLFLQAQRLNTPLLMASARLSERSARRFKRAPGLVGATLQAATWIGAQSSADLNRFVECGARPQQATITGNLKFDLNVAASLEEQGVALRSQWNPLRPVVIVGSTHEADEAVVIPAFVALLKTFPDALLIVAPRHPERFGRVIQQVKAAGLHTALRSEGAACTEQTQCFVIDTLGELMTYYACADIAYVGGSMGEQGGHNALEPAALGKPVLFGPNMNNAKEISAQLLGCNAAWCVNNQAEFQQAVEKILLDSNRRDNMGQAGRTLVEKNRGALALTMQAVKRELEKETGVL